MKFTLRCLFVVIAVGLCCLRLGYVLGYQGGFGEGPIRLSPGDLPDNWTPPVKDLEKVKDR